MIVPFDDWSLSIKALEIRGATYAQISARQCGGVQLGPYSTLRRERFFWQGPFWFALNDWSYDCVAKALAGAIVDATTSDPNRVAPPINNVHK
jgi:hypothetical protein